MYHDQVLSPFKSIYKFDAINATLGLKYLRVSPDHGTGFNIIGKNKGDSLSLIRSIKFVNKLENNVCKKISWTEFFDRQKYY